MQRTRYCQRYLGSDLYLPYGKLDIRPSYLLGQATGPEHSLPNIRSRHGRAGPGLTQVCHTRVSISKSIRIEKDNENLVHVLFYELELYYTTDLRLLFHYFIFEFWVLNFIYII